MYDSYFVNPFMVDSDYAIYRDYVCGRQMTINMKRARLYYA